MFPLGGKTYEADYPEQSVLVSSTNNRPAARPTHVFPDNLLQSRPKDTPREHLDILFDIPRFRIRKRHDELEEIFGARLVLGHRDRSEPFEIPPDSVLLLDRESQADQCLEQVDGVHRSDKAFILVRSVDAGNHDAVRDVFRLLDRSESGMDNRAVLSSPELYQSSLGVPFLLVPVPRSSVGSTSGNFF